MSAALHAGFAVGLLHPGMAAPLAIRSATANGREHRYAVYRNNATMALLHAFEAGYPVVRALLGVDCFLHAARECARLHPPRTPVMAEYVALLPGFLAGTPLATALPYLVDIARLEAACLQVFHAADGDALPASAWLELQADPSRLGRTCVYLQPACAWLSCTHAVADLWLAHMRAARPELAELDGIDIDTAQDALAWRDRSGRVQVAALPTGCARALDALQAGESLLQALATLTPQAWAVLLGHITRDGLAGAVHFDSDTIAEAS